MGNKAILMSIQPKWVAKILNGEKTIEVRKKFPKDYVGWVYIYCTKGKPYLKQCEHFRVLSYTEIGNKGYYLNGKVVARFWCDKVYDIEVEENDSNGNYSDTYIYCDIPDLEDQSCLDFDDIVEYLWNYDKWGGKGYAIHISKLKVFGEPIRINNFIKYDKNTLHIDNCVIGFGFGSCKRLTDAPQSWCYVEN